MVVAEVVPRTVREAGLHCEPNVCAAHRPDQRLAVGVEQSITLARTKYFEMS